MCLKNSVSGMISRLKVLFIDHISYRFNDLSRNRLQILKMISAHIAINIPYKQALRSLGRPCHTHYGFTSLAWFHLLCTQLHGNHYNIHKAVWLANRTNFIKRCHETHPNQLRLYRKRFTAFDACSIYSY